MFWKIVLTLVAVLLCQSLALPAFGQGEGDFTALRLVVNAPVAEVNAQATALDVPAQVLDGRVMVPLRFLGHAVGAAVHYDSETRTILYQTADRTISLAIGSDSATVNGERQALEAPLRVVNGRSLVPLSFVRDGLGFAVRVQRDELTLLHGAEQAGDGAGAVDAVTRSTDQGQQVAIIKRSYQRALGRDPNQGELDFWLGVLRSYPWAANVDTLVRYHGSWLRSNAYTAAGDDVVRRAYQAVFRRQPNAVELRGAQDWIRRDGETYETLVERLGRARAAQEAHAADQKRRQAEEAVDLAYRKLLDREPDAAGRQHYVDRILKDGWSVEDVWTAIARSPERLQRFGYWAPARVDYGGKREQCFGAVGPRCDGAPGTPEPEIVGRFRRPDGVEMGWFKIAVAPGSILHDNICLRQPLGAWCSGWPTVPLHELPLIKALMPAAMEWNKAVYNVVDKRFWIDNFGPYPVDPALRAQFSDDLTAVPNRPSYMAPVGVLGGVGALPWNFVKYEAGEPRRTRALHAPAGTAVDRGDNQFCQSGSYREDGNFFVQKFWGICN